MTSYEIENPSDAAFLDAESDEVAALAVIQLGSGWYGAKTIDGKTVCGVVALGGMAALDEWWQETFGRRAADAWAAHRLNVAAALETVRLRGERTSMNDIVGNARRMAARIRSAST